MIRTGVSLVSEVGWQLAVDKCSEWLCNGDFLVPYIRRVLLGVKLNAMTNLCLFTPVSKITELVLTIDLLTTALCHITDRYFIFF